MGTDKIRNFCIIAHIDHGKSTLADRILQITNAVEDRVFHDQYLDSNAIERERGITIKAKAVALDYRGVNLNLIDTPGHADFNYEVSKSLAACEGAILVVDATQGVQAQTVANALLAMESGLTIIPVINKIDLGHAQIEETKQQVVSLLGADCGEMLPISAKAGIGVDVLMEEIVHRIPPPQGSETGELQALIFDSNYDDYRGVVVYIRVRHGRVKPGDRIKFMATNKEYEVEEVGVFMPKMKPVESLSAGQVGYVIATVKSIRDVRIGDTLAPAGPSSIKQLPGYREPVPMVFCEFYPAGQTNFEDLTKAIDRLSLNDAAFTFAPQHSDALGPGYHCGFLGLLHMEIIQERLERENEIEIIKTAPQVTFVLVTGDKTIRIDSASKIVDENVITEWREPLVALKIVCPSEFIGAVMKLCEQRRGQFVKQEYIGATRVILTYDMPFCEMVFDFYDKLKSVTRGYATMDYMFIDYFPSDLVRLRILIAGKEVDALSTIVHRSRSEEIGRKIVRILRKEIPKHMFQIALQASIGGRVVARENISGLKRDVMGKAVSGGDFSRKRKIIERQKEGRKRLKQVGTVDIPQEAFMAVLKATTDDEEEG